MLYGFVVGSPYVMINEQTYRQTDGQST